MLVKLAVMEMTPSQCRGARGLLDWSQTDLARAAGVGLSTVYDFEKNRRAVSREKVQAIRIALEIAGVMFDGGNGGVKLRKGTRR
jgi:transcriptional regulator with XRE-family HTH domain